MLPLQHLIAIVHVLMKLFFIKSYSRFCFDTWLAFLHSPYLSLSSLISLTLCLLQSASLLSFMFIEQCSERSRFEITGIYCCLASFISFHSFSFVFMFTIALKPFPISLGRAEKSHLNSLSLCFCCAFSLSLKKGGPSALNSSKSDTLLICWKCFCNRCFRTFHRMNWPSLSSVLLLFVRFALTLWPNFTVIFLIALFNISSFNNSLNKKRFSDFS